MPITGTLTAREACHTMRSATGFTAGPESPPTTFASTGRRVYTSTAMPVSVLISDIASAPASSAARAHSAMSATLGESLTISGFLASALVSLTMLYMDSGRVPKATPPSFTLGQDMFISSMSTSLADSRAAM